MRLTTNFMCEPKRYDPSTPKILVGEYHQAVYLTREVQQGEQIPEKQINPLISYITNPSMKKAIEAPSTNALPVLWGDGDDD